MILSTGAQPRSPRAYALLQVINGHVFELNLLGTIDVSSIGENANGHARAGNVGEPASVSQRRAIS